ncbi:MAG TPA: phosphoribosylanthranilate isomerase [Mobilitalea sp.]|nr:phosphoribosylanthranilate isomerase [Mobilitalea sp.]
MSKIKICGLSRPADIDMVNKVLPDYIGFVFAQSRRQVSEATARELKAMLSDQIQAVGVFVNAAPKTIISICKAGIIDIIQLHGDEDEEYISSLKALVSKPIMKAVRVRSTEDILETAKLTCDYLLLDAYKEDQYGGSGETFDWTVITKTSKPFFLAGGINTGNVEHALSLANPYCIDVSSGVETDGFKDYDKIKDIVAKVRSKAD